MTQSISDATNSSFNSAGSFSKAQTDSIGKDQFLKLLTFQLKSQNPLDPYDNQQFASQLAQFSQLEQLTDIRSLMEEQVSMNSLLSETISNSALPGMLGKSAKAYTNKIVFDGSDEANLGYEAPRQAAKGQITIYNEFGGIVKVVDLEAGDLSKGDHNFVWDGNDSSGHIAPAGKYFYDVQLTDSNGSSYSADTYVNGKIQAVRFKPEGTVFVIDGGEVPLDRVSDIINE